MTVGQIVADLAAKTNPQNTPDWDPVGLQLGDVTAPVGSVAVCHEVTESVLTALEETPVDLVVTYHPLLFHPTNRILNERSAGGRAFRLINLGTNVLVTHTDFDAAPDGTADALARLFNLREVVAFGADEETGLPAIGRVGLFQGTLGAVEATVADAFGHVGVRVSGDRDKHVERLAVVPGSGSSLVAQAVGLAEAIVTGDIQHHTCVAALEAGLAIVDPGHTATERPGMTHLVDLIGRLTGLEVADLTSIDPQTWS